MTINAVIFTVPLLLPPLSAALLHLFHAVLCGVYPRRDEKPNDGRAYLQHTLHSYILTPAAAAELIVKALQSNSMRRNNGYDFSAQVISQNVMMITKYQFAAIRS